MWHRAERYCRLMRSVDMNVLPSDVVLLVCSFLPPGDVLNLVCAMGWTERHFCDGPSWACIAEKMAFVRMCNTLLVMCAHTAAFACACTPRNVVCVVTDWSVFSPETPRVVACYSWDKASRGTAGPSLQVHVDYERVMDHVRRMCDRGCAQTRLTMHAPQKRDALMPLTSEMYMFPVSLF